MPIYEYECTRCNSHFEVFQKITARPKRKCEKCGGPLTKLISQSSFHLKGSGWYVTDYANKGAKKPGTEPPKAEKKDTKKTETKSKAKTKKD